jgi:hypothetical protein
MSSFWRQDRSSVTAGEREKKVRSTDGISSWCVGVRHVHGCVASWFVLGCYWFGRP